MRLFKRIVLVTKECARVHHALTEEGIEEVVAAIVVLANDALVLFLGVDGDLGNEAGDEELQVVLRQRITDELATGVQKSVHVRDVDQAIQVALEQRGHRNLARCVPGSEAAVLEGHEIGQLGRLGHGWPSVMARSAGPKGNTTGLSVQQGCDRRGQDSW